MPADRFEQLVAEAIESLPEKFLSRFNNVVVVVEDRPSREQLDHHGLGPGETLFGLYEGVPMTDRGSYSPVMPDRITIFRRPLEQYCDSEEELAREVRNTVIHEVAHFFGIDDDRLDELGL
ncbi:MAG: metallopeptidase family protein [Chloroflexi bacterium]|nr:metallopeptidase family protein [Chloroflexota bacterium]MDA1298107.1 metallopeptidase family protein [Chloroflexota bacterium]